MDDRVTHNFVISTREEREKKTRQGDSLASPSGGPWRGRLGTSALAKLDKCASLSRWVSLVTCRHSVCCTQQKGARSLRALWRKYPIESHTPILLFLVGELTASGKGRYHVVTWCVVLEKVSKDLCCATIEVSRSPSAVFRQDAIDAGDLSCVVVCRLSLGCCCV